MRARRHLRCCSRSSSSCCSTSSPSTPRTCCARCWRSSSCASTATAGRRASSKRWCSRRRRRASASIAPAYNEQTTIVESMRSLLLLNYPQFEVICVNDGSKDETLTRAIGGLRPGRGADGRRRRDSRRRKVRAIYRSLTHAEFVLVDKENGGRADALNAGINAARYPLICLIDADSLLEPNALSAGGAAVPRVAGHARRRRHHPRRQRLQGRGGRVTEVRVPGNWVARFQVVEYLRAFLAGRVAHSAMGALLIISGAFGLFRRAGRARGRRPRAQDRSARTWSCASACTASCATQAAVPARVPARPGVLDRGAREPPASSATSATAGSAACSRCSATTAHDRQPALRHRRHAGAAVLRRCSRRSVRSSRSRATS